MPARLLYWGTLSRGSTSLARSRALSVLVREYHAVNSDIILGEYLSRPPWQRIKIRLAVPQLVKAVELQLNHECRRFRPDCVWIDQGVLVSRRILAAMRAGGVRLVHYTLDSLRAPGLLTRVLRNALPEYDHCITSKAHELADYERLGARDVLLGYDGIDPDIHRPVKLTEAEQLQFGCDVVFIGQAMRSRADLIHAVSSRTAASVKIYGRGWRRVLAPYALQHLDHGWVYGDEYARALCGAKIALGLLNDSVGDQQTTRSFEIPACRTFMLAERTTALCGLFREDREAVFFGSAEELSDKIQYYLRNDTERERIAEAGYQRVQDMRCSWRHRMGDLLIRIGFSPQQRS